MGVAGAAALFCRATDGLAAEVMRFGQTYGQHVRRVSAEARAYALDVVHRDPVGAMSLQRTALFSQDEAVWLSGRVWHPKQEEESLREWLTSLPRMQFRSDQVDYNILADADGVPASLSFSFSERDYVHWKADTGAVDRRILREYEIGIPDDVRDFPGLEGRSRYVDRTHTDVVPARWYHPEEPRRAWTVTNHGFFAQDKGLIRIKVGEEPSGEPKYAAVIIGGREFGDLLVTNPDFWRLAEINGGDLIFTGCSLAGHDKTFAELSARGVHSHGLERPVHAATGTTWQQASNPDGTLLARPREGATDVPWLDWDPRPARSSIVVLDGKFVTFYPL
ncbi:hypothetical protein [Nocardia donostiensis]|uniref:Uncharacterized protein n=1 Tax=Nocardia donostiensis TaxID=1538463 RepID=A0A1W0BCS8_9NOCA|nr:hypothetical protein [Nocardia donostiensis]ONM48077.1 hypothetical protein B0T46_13730 [Nocardia donostiensis]OQS20307.1 hypothetical protein B0T44_10385 [Nocardia donostiensis]